VLIIIFLVYSLMEIIDGRLRLEELDIWLDTSDKLDSHILQQFVMNSYYSNLVGHYIIEMILYDRYNCFCNTKSLYECKKIEVK